MLYVHLENVKDYEALAWRDVVDDAGKPTGDKRSTAQHDCIGILAMQCDLREMTEKNISEWLYRLGMLKKARLDPHWRRPEEKDGKTVWVREHFDEERLKAWIGVKFNVTEVPRTKWHETYLQMVAREAQVIQYKDPQWKYCEWCDAREGSDEEGYGTEVKLKKKDGDLLCQECRS